MARSGPRPLSPRRKRLRGSKMRPADRARESTLHTGRGIPPMPKRIADNPDAKAEWERLSAILLEQQVLTPQFGDLLAVFVDTNVLYERQLADLAKMHTQSVWVQAWPDADAGRIRVSC
jgi:phage terminase small subunit